MYAIAFDMVILDLEKYYGKPYNNAIMKYQTFCKNIIFSEHKAVCI